MKVFLTIWILAVLIQEVFPSTLVRLPRHAEKNLSLVHTEYEAKYEQKGKHGNESFSSVSGKQEIVHDNCAENWNSFAEKCASLIKDLVASLANAVSSKPGDATNLQLHIKNTFKHFDNTHNCTCLNHTGKTLSDLNLSPLFKNITINTVGSSTKTDDESGFGTKHKKCRGKSQPCDGNDDSDLIADKNIMPENPISNGVGGDKSGFDQRQLKENGRPLGELREGQGGSPQTGEVADEQKQRNRALVDAEDSDMNPENTEGSRDQSTNNNRRQISYPQNLTKPQKIFKNSGDSDFNPLADDLKHPSSSLKRSEGVRYPFFVTARPNSQSNKPFETPTIALNPPSLSGPSLESNFPISSEYEPSSVLLSQENSSASTAVPPLSSSVKSNSVPSSASYLLTPPKNGNSSLNNNYLGSAPQVVSEPHSSFNNEEDPKEEVLSSIDLSSHQKALPLPVNPLTNTNDQSPATISEKPLTKDYNLEPVLLVPAKSVNDKPSAQSPVVPPEEVPVKSIVSDSNQQLKQILPKKPITVDQALNPVLTPVEQIESEPKLMPSVMQPEKIMRNSKSGGQPIAVLTESPLLTKNLDSELALPINPVDIEPNKPSSVILPEQSITDSRILKPGFIPHEQVENGPDAISSPITKSNQQPIVILPKQSETKSIASDISETAPESNKSNINSPATISTVPYGAELPDKEQSISLPEEFNLPKNIKSESSGLIPETDVTILNPSPIYETLTPNSSTNPLPGTAVPGRNPSILSPEEILPLGPNGLPFSEKSTTAKSPTYKPSTTSSSSNPLPGTVVPGRNPSILSPEEILPLGPNGLPFSEKSTTAKSPIYKPSTTSSSSNPLPGTAVPGRNPSILSPEEILPLGPNGLPFSEKSTTAKSPTYKPSTTSSSSNPLPGTVVPSRNPSILSPEEILSVDANGQPLFEEQTTTECDQTTGDNLDHNISMMKPISKIPEIANQQSRISIPVEKQLPDKANQLTEPDSYIPEVPESTLPQKAFSGVQYPDAETVKRPIGKVQYPQEEVFTTPLPFYPVKTVTVIPEIGQQFNPQPAVIVEDPEIRESQGKDFETETPKASNIPEISFTKDQQKQPKTVVVGDTLLNGEQISISVPAPEIAVTTPFIIYPVKYLPNSDSPKSSDSNQKPEVQTDLSTTPVPVYPVKPTQAIPMITEQQNGNAATDDYSTSDSLNEEEHPVTYAPVRESDNVQHPQIIVKPNEISIQLTPSNFDDHPQIATDLNSVSSSKSVSETIPVISSEPQLETMVPPTPLKPEQSGVLTQHGELHPHQEEQNPLLIQPTTFQTTSEDPTPSQVNASGLLTHTTSVPQDSDETVPIKPSTFPKTTSIYEHDDDDDDDCCSCESCTEEEITDPKQYKETACKNLEEARKELKAIFEKIKKKLKCGRKAPQVITSS